MALHSKFRNRGNFDSGTRSSQSVPLEEAAKAYLRAYFSGDSEWLNQNIEKTFNQHEGPESKHQSADEVEKLLVLFAIRKLIGELEYAGFGSEETIKAFQRKDSEQLERYEDILRERSSAYGAETKAFATRSRFGEPEYQAVISYVNNVEEDSDFEEIAGPVQHFPRPVFGTTPWVADTTPQQFSPREYQDTCMPPSLFEDTYEGLLARTSF